MRSGRSSCCRRSGYCLAGGRRDDAAQVAHALLPPAQLGEHRVSLRGGVLRHHPRGGPHARARHAVLSDPLQPRDVRHQRRLRLRVRPAQSAQGWGGGGTARPCRAPCNAARRTDHERAVPRLSVRRGVRALRRGAGAERVRGDRLFGPATAVQGAAVPRLAHLEHPLRVARRVRAHPRRGDLHVRRSGRCSQRSSSGGSPRTPSVLCRTSSPTATAGSRRSPR